MKNLIYMCAYGTDIYMDIANECIESIRKSGFDGDLILLNDRIEHSHDLISSANYARLIKFIPDKGRLPRCQIREFINLREYDKVMYLDCDILAIGSLEAVFDRAVAPAIAVPEEAFRIGDMILNHLYLTHPQKRNAAIMSQRHINSGTVVMIGKYADGILEQWEKTWRGAPESTPKQFHDQAALQAMIVNGSVWHTDIPDEHYYFPLIPLDRPAKEFDPDTRLIHFNGFVQQQGHKERVLKVMRAVNNATSFEHVQTELAEFRRTSTPLKRPKAWI